MPMLRGKATLPLRNEPKHNYVGPAVTEGFAAPFVLRRDGFRAVGLLLG